MGRKFVATGSNVASFSQIGYWWLVVCASFTLTVCRASVETGLHECVLPCLAHQTSSFQESLRQRGDPHEAVVSGPIGERIGSLFMAIRLQGV